MGLSDERIQEFKEIFEKEGGKEITFEEAREGADRLVGFFDLLWKHHIKDIKQAEQLKDHPEGIHLYDGTYNCAVCYKTITGDDLWWDLLGPKCINCQTAIKRKVIPKSVSKHDNSWYAMWQLDTIFGLKYQTVKKLMKEGKLKPRIILNKDKKPYFYVFLKKENLYWAEFEDVHKQLNLECRCKDPKCIRCIRIICMENNCKAHLPNEKIEEREITLNKLNDDILKYTERLNDPKMENMREYNERNLDDAKKDTAYLLKNVSELKEI